MFGGVFRESESVEYLVVESQPGVHNTTALQWDFYRQIYIYIGFYTL